MLVLRKSLFHLVLPCHMSLQVPLWSELDNMITSVGVPLVWYWGRTLMSLGPVYMGHCIYRAAPRRSRRRWSVASIILTPLIILGCKRNTRISAVLRWEWNEGSTHKYGPHTNMETWGLPIVFPHDTPQANLKEVWTSTSNFQLCMRWEDTLHICWHCPEYILCFLRSGDCLFHSEQWVSLYFTNIFLNFTHAS